MHGNVRSKDISIFKAEPYDIRKGIFTTIRYSHWKHEGDFFNLSNLTLD